MAEDIKSRVRSFYRTLESGDLKDLDQWVAPDYVDHSPPPGSSGDREGLRQYFDSLRRAFSDFRLNVEDIIAEGDRVAARVTGQGTHASEFMGLQPTGKRVTVPFFDLLRFENGKIVEHWGVQDLLHMMHQLGMVSMPGRRAA